MASIKFYAPYGNRSTGTLQPRHVTVMRFGTEIYLPSTSFQHYYASINRSLGCLYQEVVPETSNLKQR
jgi:hypothetical protein